MTVFAFPAFQFSFTRATRPSPFFVWPASIRLQNVVCATLLWHHASLTSPPQQRPLLITSPSRLCCDTPCYAWRSSRCALTACPSFVRLLLFLTTMPMAVRSVTTFASRFPSNPSLSPGLPHLDAGHRPKQTATNQLIRVAVLRSAVLRRKKQETSPVCPARPLCTYAFFN